MPLPTPKPKYDPADEAQTRVLIDALLAACLRGDSDIILPYAIRLVLTSQDGGLHAVAVSNAGVLSTVAYP